MTPHFWQHIWRNEGVITWNGIGEHRIINRNPKRKYEPENIAVIKIKFNSTAEYLNVNDACNNAYICSSNLCRAIVDNQNSQLKKTRCCWNRHQVTYIKTSVDPKTNEWINLYRKKTEQNYSEIDHETHQINHQMEQWLDQKLTLLGKVEEK